MLANWPLFSIYILFKLHPYIFHRFHLEIIHQLIERNKRNQSDEMKHYELVFEHFKYTSERNGSARNKLFGIVNYLETRFAEIKKGISLACAKLTINFL